MKFRTACQDQQAGKVPQKCLSQGHKQILRVGFEPIVSVTITAL